MPENTIIGLSAWNYQVTTQLRAMLYVRTNNGLVPTDKVNEKIDLAMMMLEEFENTKQGTIIHQLAKHAKVCKLEAEVIQALPWWHKMFKIKRLEVCWLSYNVYQNAMAVILDCLPTDMQGLLQEQSPPATVEPAASIPFDPAAQIE